jgi:hypothetical protein
MYLIVHSVVLFIVDRLKKSNNVCLILCVEHMDLIWDQVLGTEPLIIQPVTQSLYHLCYHDLYRQMCSFHFTVSNVGSTADSQLSDLNGTGSRSDY